MSSNAQLCCEYLNICFYVFRFFFFILVHVIILYIFSRLLKCVGHNYFQQLLRFRYLNSYCFPYFSFIIIIPITLVVYKNYFLCRSLIFAHQIVFSFTFIGYNRDEKKNAFICQFFFFCCSFIFQAFTFYCYCLFLMLRFVFVLNE